MTRNFRVMEAFSGIGSQALALKIIFENSELLKSLGFDIDNLKLKIVGTSEWYISAILAYDEIHNGPKKDFEGYDELLEKKEEMLKHISNFNLSNDSKEPYEHSKIEKWNVHDIRDLYISLIRSKNYGSITDIKGKDLPKIDLLTWSAPCQDLSLAGKGLGIEQGVESRSALLWHILRVLDEMGKSKPKVLLMENVEGLITKKHYKDWVSVEKILEDMGYRNTLIRLNSKDFGVPHSRDRVFCISILVDDKSLVGKGNIQVQKKASYTPLREFIGVDNEDFIEEYKLSIPNNTPGRRDYIAKSTHLNHRDYCDTITTSVDRRDNSGIFFCDKNGMLVDDIDINVHQNGKKSCFRFLTSREMLTLMGFKSEHYDLLKNIDLKDSQINVLSGNSIVVPVLEAIFIEIIKEVIPKKRVQKPQGVNVVYKRKYTKRAVQTVVTENVSNGNNRVAKIVATKTKKMKARVLDAIKKLKDEGLKINAHRVSKVAGISYVTARKYWKLLNISKKITQKEIFENIEFELLKRCGHVRVIFTKYLSKCEIFTNRERYFDESKFDLEDELVLNNARQEHTKTSIKIAIGEFFNLHYNDSFNVRNKGSPFF